MDKNIKDLIEAKFKAPIAEGENKRCSLQEAIRNHLKKGQAINVSNAI